MKKLSFFIIGLFILTTFSSCMEDAEVWDSSVNGLSGQWYVRYDSKTQKDPFGSGYTEALTFNTAADDGKEIYLTDIIDGTPSFWKYRVRVPVDVSKMSFGTNDVLTNDVEDYEIKVKVMNGKVTPKAKTLPSGYVADSIYFEIWYDDLPQGTDKLIATGYRKTGFEEDEP
ncbi:MAG: lipid-binding protein [Bacteroidales bacterium]